MWVDVIALSIQHHTHLTRHVVLMESVAAGEIVPSADLFTMVKVLVGFYTFFVFPLTSSQLAVYGIKSLHISHGPFACYHSVSAVAAPARTWREHSTQTEDII